MTILLPLRSYLTAQQKHSYSDQPWSFGATGGGWGFHADEDAH